MQASVFFSFREVEGQALQDQTVVVIDVLRTTSTIVAALAAGAEAIYPVVSIEDAMKLATSLGRKDALLAGERRGHAVDGFDLGNSPSEFTPESVGGKRVVMSTTNGTAALVAAAGADRVLVGSFVNVSAVANAVAGVERLALVCAGREGRYSLDDALCAGILLLRLTAKLGAALELEDGGRTALALATLYVPHPDFLLTTSSGTALAEIGLAEDVRWCAREDVFDLVPELSDRMIRSRRGA
jgi:2-phosphosulfolactate phosphatase